MQLARVVGHAVSTVKHPSLHGWRLVLVQAVHGDKLDGEPLLAIDSTGAGVNDIVIISSDGAAARALVKDRKSPARWQIVGVRDG